MANVLAYRTKLGGESIPGGQTKQLGVVDVAKFERIRIVADERVGSASNITIRLTITEGNELVAFLDSFTLAPHAQITRVYEVPGTKLTISGVAGPGAGSDGVDVLIYGWTE